MSKQKSFVKKPCKNCPWKRSSKAGGEDIPNFSIEMMRDLKKTTFEADCHPNERDALRPVFACHDTKEGKEATCAGYVARDGKHNITVRFLAASDNVDLRPIIEAAEENELYNDFHEMLEDYEKALKSDD